jgi:ABC-type bacteriocin/lantibiotic exporter with double-glycine peptidase domain
VFDGPSDGSGDAGALVPINGDLEFKSIQFAFPSRPARLIYSDMSLDIAQKESIGLGMFLVLCVTCYFRLDT